jgi:hypothetical protein
MADLWRRRKGFGGSCGVRLTIPPSYCVEADAGLGETRSGTVGSYRIVHLRLDLARTLAWNSLDCAHDRFSSRRYRQLYVVAPVVAQIDADWKEIDTVAIYMATIDYSAFAFAPRFLHLN